MGKAMKRFLVIGRRNVGEKNDARELANAIAGQIHDATVTSAYYEDLVIVTGKGELSVLIHVGTNSEESLKSFDTVILINWSHDRLYTDFAHSIAIIADRLGSTVWNKELITARSSTKVSQTVALSYEAIVTPMTIFSLTPQLAKEYIDVLGMPFVAKDPLASRGRNNFLCDSWEDFIQKAADGVSYVFQEFIPNEASDLRMFVAGGKPALAILRRGTGESHLNNVSQGAVAELIPLTELPQQLLKDTEKVADMFERELCGIDFMKNRETNEYVFLEINTTPQIVNGVFAEEKAAAIARALMR